MVVTENAGAAKLDSKMFSTARQVQISLENST